MPTLTRTIDEWQEIADWCLGPGRSSCYPEGAMIAAALGARGMSHPDVPVPISGLGVGRHQRILEAERRIEAEREQCIQGAKRSVAEEHERLSGK